MSLIRQTITETTMLTMILQIKLIPSTPSMGESLEHSQTWM